MKHGLNEDNVSLVTRSQCYKEQPNIFRRDKIGADCQSFVGV
jgi:hypothetical protein